MAGAVLPLQLGEIARVYVLSDSAKARSGARTLHRRRRTAARCVRAAVLARVLLPFVDLPTVAAITSLVIAGDLSHSATVVCDRRPRPATRRTLGGVVHSLRLPERFDDTARNLAGTRCSTVSPRCRTAESLLYVIFWTFASWMTSSCVVYLVMRAFSLDVPFAAAPFVLDRDDVRLLRSVIARCDWRLSRDQHPHAHHGLRRAT